MKKIGTVLQFTAQDTRSVIDDAMALVGLGVVSRVDIWCREHVTQLKIAKVDNYGESKYVVCAAGNFQSVINNHVHVRYIDYVRVPEFILAIASFQPYTSIPTRLAPLIEFVPESVVDVPELDCMGTAIGWDNIENPLMKTVDLIHDGKLESIDVGGVTYRVANVSPFRRVDTPGHVGYGNEGMNLIVVSELPNGMCVCVEEENTLPFIRNETSGMRTRLFYLYAYVNTTVPEPYKASDISDEWIGKLVQVKQSNTKLMIIGLTDNEVIIGMDNYPLDVAFNTFTWIDGKPFGK